MGDEADYLMSLAFDDDMYEAEREIPREVMCRDCGDTDVYWAQQDGRWVLYGSNSRRHVCNKKTLTAIRLDAFDSLD